MKKLQAELSDERNTTCFIKKIESLRTDNRLINSNLKQAKDQITHLEAQVCCCCCFIFFNPKNS